VTEGVVFRTSDSAPVNNSTTLVNDDTLVIPLDANSRYIIDGIITYSSSSTADFKLDFTVPSGAVGRRALAYIPTTVTNCLSVSQQFFGAGIDVGTDPSGNVGGTGGSCEVVIRGQVTTVGTSGNFQVQWAQAVADASDTKTMEGSYLRWRKL
jgi:hypothetical protein